MGEQSNAGLQQCDGCGSEIRFGILRTHQYTDESENRLQVWANGYEEKQKVRSVPGLACDCTELLRAVPYQISDANGKIWKDADDWPEQWGGQRDC